MWSKARVQVGDVLLGLRSPNLRSNGFSLVRNVFHDLIHGSGDLSPDERTTLQQLCAPSVLYSPKLQQLSTASRRQIHAAAHITGGGLLANLARVIPRGLSAEVVRDSWTIPSVFHLIADRGSVEQEEMLRTFNMGIGMVLVVDRDSHLDLLEVLEEVGLEALPIGMVEEGSPEEESARFKDGDESV
jgi:phosphoribosylformylglycinamidine cyclo-ligase